MAYRISQQRIFGNRVATDHNGRLVPDTMPKVTVRIEAMQSTPTWALANWRNVSLCIMRPGELATYDAVPSAQAGLRQRYPGGIVTITVLDGDFSPLFSAEARARAREQLATTHEGTLAMAIVILRRGLLASVTRSTMNALSAIVRLEVKWRIFDDIGAASQWVLPWVDGPCTSVELEQAVQLAFALPDEARARIVG